MSSPSSKRRTWIARLLLSLLVFLVLGEIAARVWVASNWTRDRVEQLTTHSSVRGHFASHPYLPYTINPDYPGHNALGFRGGPMDRKKAAGVTRIACLGASTTYGIFVEPDEAFPAQLGLLLERAHRPSEVLNAGVPGWVSIETLIDLQLRILPLEPDFVVILQGRNEILPQAYDDFQPDYTHFRRPGFNYSVSNYMHKEIFRWSRLAMLACTLRGERFGWSEIAEHPLYGGVFWENRPTAAEAARNLEDPARMATLQNSLECMIELCQARGIRVVVCTMAFRSELLAQPELDLDARLKVRLGDEIERNNELARAVARRFGATVVETAQLASRAELFLDDCHMNAEGHHQSAQLIFDALEPMLGSH